MLSAREPVTASHWRRRALFAHDHREHRPDSVGIIADHQEGSLPRFQYRTVARLRHFHDRQVVGYVDRLAAFGLLLTLPCL